MSLVMKRVTKLPVNIWIDETSSYKRGKHNKRIKFQLNKQNKSNSHNSRIFASMRLDGSVVKQTLEGKKVEISAKDIKAVSTFVKNNSLCLELISDQDLDLQFFLQKLAIWKDTLATENELKAQKVLLDEYLADPDVASDLLREENLREREVLLTELEKRD